MKFAILETQQRYSMHIAEIVHNIKQLPLSSIETIAMCDVLNLYGSLLIKWLLRVLFDVYNQKCRLLLTFTFIISKLIIYCHKASLVYLQLFLE